MKEGPNGVTRLLGALSRMDTSFIPRLAALLNYYPRQLAEDLASIDDVKVISREEWERLTNNETIKRHNQILKSMLDLGESGRAELLDTGLFNHFLEAYCYLALRNSGIKGEVQKGVLHELRALLDDINAVGAAKIYDSNSPG